MVKSSLGLPWLIDRSRWSRCFSAAPSGSSSNPSGPVLALEKTLLGSLSQNRCFQKCLRSKVRYSNNQESLPVCRPGMALLWTSAQGTTGANVTYWKSQTPGYLESSGFWHIPSEQLSKVNAKPVTFKRQGMSPCISLSTFARQEDLAFSGMGRFDGWQDF